MSIWHEPSAHAANGMPLWEIPLLGTRAVSIVISFAAGARHEQDQESGLAHFIEHLTFKRSDRYSSYTELRQSAKRLGGLLNAYTSQNVVAFHITGRSEYLMGMLDLLSEFTASAHLTAEHIEAEREIVLQEIACSEDSTEKLAGRLAVEVTYGDHQLGRPVLGSRERIAGFTRANVISFRDRRWIPSQGLCMLAGDLSGLKRGEALEMLGRYPLRTKAPAPAPAPAFVPRRELREADVTQTKLWHAWNWPVDMRDISVRAGMGLIQRILSDRLVEELRQKRSLCYSTGAGPNDHADAPRLWTLVGCAPERAGEAHELLASEVARIAHDGVTQDEYEYARVYVGTQEALGREGAQVVARAGSAHIMAYDLQRFNPDAFVDAVDAVTHQELCELAANLDVASGQSLAVVGPHELNEFS